MDSTNGNNNDIMWDDTEILNAFHNSIHNHKTKKVEELSKKRKSNDINIESSSGLSEFASVDLISNYEHSITKQQLSNGNPDEAALSSMLMAWYQSGYATGRYHTLLELKSKGCVKCDDQLALNEKCDKFGANSSTSKRNDTAVGHVAGIITSVCSDLEEGEI